MPYKSVSVANTSVFTVATPEAGMPDERVRLTGGALVAANTTTVQFQTSTGNANLTGAMTLIAGVPLVFPSSPGSPGSGRRYGYLQSLRGDSLQLVLGGSVQVSGFLEFELVNE